MQQRIFEQLYRPFFHYFRSRRMAEFQRTFHPTAATRVLDIGGGIFNWTLLPEPPQLVIVNLYPPRRDGKEEIWVRAGRAQWVVADARHLPFRDDAFDIAYSNSVIEHVGTYDSQQQFAAEAQRVGHHYFVQTPNRAFFFEPHYLTPFVHWLPKSLQRHLLRDFTVWGWFFRPTPEKVEEILNEIRLLSEEELQTLFPNASVTHEKVAMMTKAFVILG